VGWSVGVLALVLIEGAIWPSMRDVADMAALLREFPEVMQELFDLSAMTTGMGFFNVELFSLLLPAIFVIFGIARGARAIAGEEEAGTLDVLLVSPRSTTSILLQKAAALAVALALLTLVLWAGTIAISAMFDLGIGVTDAGSGALASFLIGLEFGALALAVGAVTGRRLLAIGLAGTLAVASYVLYALGALVDELEPWQPWSPFDQIIATGPLGAGLPSSFLWPAVVAVAVVAIAVPVFGRRDIAAR
jgi:ABC-2 type transport system permease protein